MLGWQISAVKQHGRSEMPVVLSMIYAGGQCVAYLETGRGGGGHSQRRFAAE